MLLISTIENRYKALTAFKPENELVDYVQELNHHSNATRYIIPNITNIFDNRQLVISNDLVSATFDIPLLLDRLLEEFIIITVPNKNLEIIRLPSSTKVLHLVVKDGMYGIIQDSDAIIYDIRMWRPIDKCMQDILTTSNKAASTCPQAVDTEHISETVKVNNVWTIIFSKNETIIINCKGDPPIAFKNPALLINASSLCVVTINNESTVGQIYGYGHFNSTDEIKEIGIPLSQPAKLRIHELETLYNEAEESLDFDSTSNTWKFGVISGITATIVCTIIIALIYIYYRRTKMRRDKEPDDKWLPTFVGPVVSTTRV